MRKNEYLQKQCPTIGEERQDRICVGCRGLSRNIYFVLIRNSGNEGEVMVKRCLMASVFTVTKRVRLSSGSE